MSSTTGSRIIVSSCLGDNSNIFFVGLFKSITTVLCFNEVYFTVILYFIDKVF